LGNHFDLHTGGIDNMFPHHEDEIAQSEACNGCKYVNYWLHCAHLQVNGKKMSKSLGNFHTIRQLVDKGFSGAEIRWVLLSTHYRVGLNFEIDSTTLESKSLSEAKSAIQRLNTCVERINEKGSAESSKELSEFIQKMRQKFLHALNNDLNIAEALAAVFEFVREVNKTLDSGEKVGKSEALEAMKYFNQILDVIEFEKKDTIPAEIHALAKERLQARADKNWARADQIRQELTAKGYIIEDSPEGPKVKKI
jgi:cysteinyl-tRNA synthetase